MYTALPTSGVEYFSIIIEQSLYLLLLLFAYCSSKSPIELYEIGPVEIRLRCSPTVIVEYHTIILYKISSGCSRRFIIRTFTYTATGPYYNNFMYKLK